MGVYDELLKLDSESPTPKVTGETKKLGKEIRAKKKTENVVDQSTDQSTNRSTKRSID